MFEAPVRNDIGRVVIDADVVNGFSSPHIYTAENLRIEWNDNGKLNTAA
jgi:hypothetical protein